MTKAWFRFSRPIQQQDDVAPDTTNAQEAFHDQSQGALSLAEQELTAIPDVADVAHTPELRAVESTREAINEMNEAETARPATDLEPTMAENNEDNEDKSATPVPELADAPTSPPTARLALTLARGEQAPTYVDQQTAGDWLAMLSQISAVTAYKALSYDLLDLRPGERAVDVGCGIGQDARELARRVGPTGSVVGIDGSAEMIAKAIAATNDTTAQTLRFIEGDATALPIESGAYDALRADRLLQHVDDPLQALVEFRRVLRPGARIVLIEPDWKTMAVYPGSAAGGDNDRCVAAIFDWHVAHTRHPLIGRSLRMLLAQAGFVSVSVTPIAYASTSFIEADLTLELTRAATGAAEQWPKRLSAREAQAWRVTAQAADTAGHFFASAPLYFAHAIVE